MTTDVRDESAKNGVVRRHSTSVTRPAVVDSVLADLGAMCHHIADLARTRPEPPRRIRVEHLGTALEIEWPSPVAKGAPVAATHGAGSATAAEESTTAESAAGGSAAPVAGSATAVKDGLRRVCAPMIGTFYHAPEPGAPPFVAVGDTVVPGQQVGILEVMKMMSAVHADVAGTVREILVPDGGPVEFQQALIAVEPVGEG